MFELLAIAVAVTTAVLEARAWATRSASTGARTCSGTEAAALTTSTGVRACAVTRIEIALAASTVAVDIAGMGLCVGTETIVRMAFAMGLSATVVAREAVTAIGSVVTWCARACVARRAKPAAARTTCTAWAVIAAAARCGTRLELRLKACDGVRVDALTRELLDLLQVQCIAV